MLANVKKNCQDGKDQGNLKSIYYVLGLFFREIYLSVKTVGFIQVSTNHNLAPLYKTGKLIKIMLRIYSFSELKSVV